MRHPFDINDDFQGGVIAVAIVKIVILRFVAAGPRLAQYEFKRSHDV